MKVTQKKTNDGHFLLECVASAEDVQKVLYTASCEFASQMGLKPEQGKSVDDIIKEKLGIKDIDSMVQGRAIEMLAPYALDKKDIIPMYQPTPMATSELKRGQSFSFTMNVAPKPNYELTSYDGIEVTVQPFTPDTSSVEGEIQKLAERFVTFARSENQHAAEKGDTCLIAVDASVDGEPLTGLNTDGRPFVVGEGYMPEGFDENVLGMMPGETKSFTFEGPSWDSNGDETKEVVDCTVTLIEIQNEVVPEINDEWVSNYFPMYRSLDDMRTSMEEQTVKQQREGYEQYVRNQAAQELSKRFQGKIEDAAYEAVSKTLQENLRATLKQQNMTWKQFVEENGGEQQINMMLMLETRQQLTTGLSLDALFRKKKLVVSEEDILDACRAFDPQNPGRVRKELEETGRGFALREAAERACAAKWLVAHSTIREAARDAAPAADAAEAAEETAE